MEITQSEMIIVQQSIKDSTGKIQNAFGNVGKGTPAPVLKDAAKLKDDALTGKRALRNSRSRSRGRKKTTKIGK